MQQGATYTHTGHRYVLGYGADFYGIWDRAAPSEPVERFPRDDGGWQSAWQRFGQLEPGGVPVGGGPPVGGSLPVAAAGYPAGGGVYARRTNGMAVAALVLGIVWIYGVGSLLALIFGLLARGDIDRSGGAQGGRGMAVAGIVLGIIGLVGAIALFTVYAINPEAFDTR
ncbi:MAG: DUF4190 domain-containing protein [Actinobacteria bacterium]|nr:DUF4190 domain-containing protein [Actinomycetota bacterium]